VVENPKKRVDRMTELLNWSVKFSGFKCFGKEPQGLDAIKPVNLLIGRNNAGKSALIDAIGTIMDIGQSGNYPEEVFYSTVPSQSTIDDFSHKTPRSLSGVATYVETKLTGFVLENRRFCFRKNPDQGPTFVSEDYAPLEDDALRQAYDTFSSWLYSVCPLRKKQFRRIGAARDIVPEALSDLDPNCPLKEDGTGATNILSNFLHNTDYESQLVEEQLRTDLNQIISPDAEFKRIQAKFKQRLYEIFLEEEHKGPIPLSASGSGLKTILLVLTYVHLYPVVEKKKLRDYVLTIEEPENNLHPATIRKLLFFLREKAVHSGLTVFITTHSSIALDLFARDEAVQIVHVSHDGRTARTRSVLEYGDKRAILDELDVRASDILQSNGVIWVEGPSDRTYLKRWIELWSDGVLKEGIHYQCLLYGGKLIRHLSANPENDQDIEILRANRNAVIVIDRDRPNGKEPINETKQRIVKEFEDNGLMAWVTQGREIENYLPKPTLDSYLEGEISKGLGTYTKFEDFLKKRDKDKHKIFKKSKYEFAEDICPYIEKDAIANHLDLSEQLEKICKRIRNWNGLT
jgi:putative ATP-dependent endonuclease of OLD family